MDTMSEFARLRLEKQVGVRLSFTRRHHALETALWRRRGPGEGRVCGG